MKRSAFYLRLLLCSFFTFCVIFSSLSINSFASYVAPDYTSLQFPVGNSDTITNHLEFVIYNTESLTLSGSYSNATTSSSTPIISSNGASVYLRPPSNSSSNFIYTVKESDGTTFHYAVPRKYSGSASLRYFTATVPFSFSKNDINWLNVYENGASVSPDSFYKFNLVSTSQFNNSFPSSILDYSLDLVCTNPLYSGNLSQRKSGDISDGSGSLVRNGFSPSFSGADFVPFLNSSYSNFDFALVLSGIIDSSAREIRIPFTFNTKLYFNDVESGPGINVYDNSLNNKFDDFSNTFNDRFIPDDGSSTSSDGEASGQNNAFGGVYSTLYDIMEEKLGFLSFPFMLLVSLLEGISSDGSFSGITFPEISWQGQVIIPETLVTFPDIGIQDTIYFVTDIVLIGAFIILLQNKLREVLTK